jgi:hypothetical protein
VVASFRANRTYSSVDERASRSGRSRVQAADYRPALGKIAGPSSTFRRHGPLFATRSRRAPTMAREKSLRLGDGRFPTRSGLEPHALGPRPHEAGSRVDERGRWHVSERLFARRSRRPGALMADIHLHVGHRKTGTSSIQAALDALVASLAEAGVLYPGGRHRAHRLAA